MVEAKTGNELNSHTNTPSFKEVLLGYVGKTKAMGGTRKGSAKIQILSSEH